MGSAISTAFFIHNLIGGRSGDSDCCNSMNANFLLNIEGQLILFILVLVHYISDMHCANYMF